MLTCKEKQELQVLVHDYMGRGIGKRPGRARNGGEGGKENWDRKGMNRYHNHDILSLGSILTHANVPNIFDSSTYSKLSPLHV